MVMNLDKCIGCHTCTVTCKQVWTNRPGTEYVYFNNVETKPGVGYPKRYEDQEQWHGGWALDSKGRLQLKAGGRLRKLLSIFYNPDLPTIDDYGDPWTYDYQTLIEAPLGTRNPSAHSISALTGQDMTVNWGSNFEDDLAGAPEHAAADPNLARARGQVSWSSSRCSCSTCRASASTASTRPASRPALRGDVQARGGRHRPGRPGPVPGLAVLRLRLPVQEGLLQPPHRQGREVHVLLPAHRGRPADDLLGDLRRAASLPRPGPLRRRQGPRRRRHARRAGSATRRSCRCSSTPRTRRCRPRRAEQGIPDDWMQAARRSPVYELAVRHRVALPLHPEYRTLPMVWYIPPLSPVRTSCTRPATTTPTPTTCSPPSTRCGSRSSTSPACSPPATPTPCAVLRKLAAVRAHPARRAARAGAQRRADGGGGRQPDELDDLYRLLAIAKYDDRYVIPPAHAEDAGG